MIDSTLEGARLLAAVYAAPGDHGPRIAYGDWLRLHGDPRSELIALQRTVVRTPAVYAQIAALVARHGKARSGLWQRRGHPVMHGDGESSQ